MTIRLFAHLRLAAGAGAIGIDVPDGCTLGTALETFYALRPDLREAAATSMTAVGLEYADGGRTLVPGEEISLIPPVQGG